MPGRRNNNCNDWEFEKFKKQKDSVLVKVTLAVIKIKLQNLRGLKIKIYFPFT